MANDYDLGDVARVSVEFTDHLTGAFVDPALVKVKVTSPSLVITTYTHPTAEIVKDAVGKYRTDVFLDEPGEWVVRWEGRTTNRAAEEVPIHARASKFYERSGDEKPDGPS
jgi:hypothetical protein